MKGFIIGTGRCGTSMLAQMLNSHSKICVPHELQILFEYSNNGPRLYEIFKDKKNERFGSEDFVELIKARCPHKFHEYFDYRSYFEKQQYPILSLKQLANSLYSEIAESKQKEMLIEQTPWYGQRIDILNELFPDAKYIHMVRDGRDVAISFARTPWWHKDIGKNLERWHAEVWQIIESSNHILSPNQMLQVRYEDFVERPEDGLRRICDFLGIGFENTMLDPATFIDYSFYSSFNEKQISSSKLNEWSKIKDVPTFKGSRYAWKDYPDFAFSRMPKHITQSLKSLGYDTQMPRFYSLMVALFNLKRYGKKLNHVHLKDG
jgi:hypothetical protein